MIKVVCPKCKKSLKKINLHLYCSKCESKYKVNNNLIDFIGQKDPFYEGKFGTDRKSSSNLIVNIKHLYFLLSVFNIRLKHEKFYKCKNEKTKVLDLGCGSGNDLLKSKKCFNVVGVDLSSSSLQNAKFIYDSVFLCSCSNLPFKNNTFDYVTSFDLIGHIPKIEKMDVFKEIYRVLKPSGLTFHYIELDSSKGYNNWAKKFPKLYQKYFIDQDGHFGLEDYKSILNHFSKSGFEVVHFEVLAKIIIPPGEYMKRFSNEYSEKNWKIRVLTFLDGLLSKNIFLILLSGLLVSPIQVIIEPFVSNDYGGLLFVVLKKK